MVIARVGSLFKVRYKSKDGERIDKVRDLYVYNYILEIRLFDKMPP